MEREGAHRAKVTVHMGTCGIAAGARAVMTALMEEVAKARVEDVEVTTSGCVGRCSREPMATVEIVNQPPIRYCDLNAEKIREIFKEHIMGGNPIEKYILPPRITIDELQRIKEKHKATFTLREGAHRAKVTVHMGTCGIAAGARPVMTALMEEIAKAGAEDVIITTSGCAGLCAREPMATVEIIGQPPIKYIDLNDQKIREIFKEHVLGGNVVEKYALSVGYETTY
ncbi:MAG: (2Fe-2S) ferredoxin domain-containing protein [Nitrospirota bacterium]